MASRDIKGTASYFCLSRRRKDFTKQHNQLCPIAQDKFRITEGLDKSSEYSVSFQFRSSSWYLRAKTDGCIIEPKKFRKNLGEYSFHPMVDLWFPGYVAFESVEKSAYYLRLQNGRLILDHYAGTQKFKEEASFFLKRYQTQQIVSDCNKHEK